MSVSREPWIDANGFEHAPYEEWVGYPMTACTCGQPWHNEPSSSTGPTMLLWNEHVTGSRHNRSVGDG